MVNSEDEILQIIKENSSKTALKNEAVYSYCETLLKEIPEYENLINICYSIRKEIPIKVCPVCGKYILYGKTKLKKDKFCSDACYRSPEGLKIAKQRRDATNIERYGSLEDAYKAHHERYVESCISKGISVGAWSPEAQAKKEATMLERYGATATLASSILAKKVKQTNLERYGVENIGGSREIRAKIDATNEKRYGSSNLFSIKKIQNKIKATNLERYGVEYVGDSQVIRERIKITNQKRYGCDFPLENKEIHKKAIKSNATILEQNVRKRVLNEDYEIVGGYNGAHKRNYIKCLRCGNEFLHNIISNKPLFCPFCDKVSGSHKENEIMAYIRSLGIIARERDRDILDGKELDIYIPDKAVAIEIDGIYWHSEAAGKNKNYHLNKTKRCEELGIQLIHIFDDEILYKGQIVKSRLRAILGKTPYKIAARSCQVREIPSSFYNKFVEKYHIQGAVNTSIRLGLYYKNRLVAVMGFNKSRFNKKYDYELMRYCTISSFNITGGAGKLLKYFRKHYQGSIISYADKRWSNGSLYHSLGFTELKDSEPNYYYVKGNTRESRQKFQKHKLEKVLEVFDPELSEQQNMCKNGWSRIWDCGNKVFVLEND